MSSSSSCLNDGAHTLARVQEDAEAGVYVNNDEILAAMAPFISSYETATAAATYDECVVTTMLGVAMTLQSPLSATAFFDALGRSDAIQRLFAETMRFVDVEPSADLVTTLLACAVPLAAHRVWDMLLCSEQVGILHVVAGDVYAQQHFSLAKLNLPHSSQPVVKALLDDDSLSNAFRARLIVSSRVVFSMWCEHFVRHPTDTQRRIVDVAGESVLTMLRSMNRGSSRLREVLRALPFSALEHDETDPLHDCEDIVVMPQFADAMPLDSPCERCIKMVRVADPSYFTRECYFGRHSYETRVVARLAYPAPLLDALGWMSTSPYTSRAQDRLTGVKRPFSE